MVNVDSLINLPSAHIKTLPLVITIYNLKDDGIVKSQTLDYGIEADRKLMGRITIWALQNGCSVETMLKADYDKQEHK